MSEKLLSGRRILLVEDEMLILLRIEDMLADLGCGSVHAAANVDDAIRLIRAGPFDAAMLDVNLDGKMSYPVADALTAGGVPFVFTTGYCSESLRAAYCDRPVLKKPYRDGELVAMFAHLLSEPIEHGGAARG